MSNRCCHLHSMCLCGIHHICACTVQVPVLKDGPLVLYESMAINCHLARRFPQVPTLFMLVSRRHLRAILSWGWDRLI